MSFVLDRMQWVPPVLGMGPLEPLIAPERHDWLAGTTCSPGSDRREVG